MRGPEGRPTGPRVEVKNIGGRNVQEAPTKLKSQHLQRYDARKTKKKVEE